MWKEFFYYTPREKRGIAVLIIGIVLAIGAKQLLKPWTHPALPETNEAFEQPPVEFANPPKKTGPILHAFDPNTADSLTFLQLGLPPWMSKNILNYRRKGGRFRKPEDFKKIYGLTEELYATLLPYIYIAERKRVPPPPAQTQAPPMPRAKKDSVSHSKAFKYPAGVTISLNQSDTTELKKIPGIGSVTARRIVNYRNQLGGFYNVEQLHEIGLESESFKEWLEVSESEIQRINLNRVSIERLRAHPYFNFYQAKAIIEYRKKKGTLKNLTVFELYEEFKDEDFARIKHYVCF